MAGQIPLVDYLVLDDDQPHLVAQECTNFDRRNACAGCFATEFKTVRVATEGTVRAFTIVTFAAPGIPTPFVASVVDCDGTQVRANLNAGHPSRRCSPAQDPTVGGGEVGRPAGLVRTRRRASARRRIAHPQAPLGVVRLTGVARRAVGHPTAAAAQDARRQSAAAATSGSASAGKSHRRRRRLASPAWVVAVASRGWTHFCAGAPVDRCASSDVTYWTPNLRPPSPSSSST